MKIASLETGIVLLPNDEPLAGFSENPNAKNPIVTLRLRTDDGIEGLGVAYFGGALTRTLRHAIDELGALAIGDDPLRVEVVAKKLRDAAGSSGPAGILTMAMSLVPRCSCERSTIGPADSVTIASWARMPSIPVKDSVFCAWRSIR